MNDARPLLQLMPHSTEQSRYSVQTATYTTTTGRCSKLQHWIDCYWGQDKTDCERWIEECVSSSEHPGRFRLYFRVKLHKARQEVRGAPAQELPRSIPSRKLRLLCLLVQTRTGETRSLPVHTLHRVPPYAGLRGRYYDEAGRGCVAFDPLDLPGGAGFYLRETHARPPSPEVLARCLRQRQAHALCAHSPAIRAGGLTHGL